MQPGKWPEGEIGSLEPYWPCWLVPRTALKLRSPLQRAYMLILGQVGSSRNLLSRNFWVCNWYLTVHCLSLNFAMFSSTEDLLPAGFPNIDMGPQLKVVERTRTATMLCAASGNPDPEITWFKDFLPIDPSTSNGRIKQLRSGKTNGCA